MYPYFPFSPELIDPAATGRNETYRPASRLEVIQRNRDADRQYLLAINEREETSQAGGQRAPGRFAGIRRSISRALIHTGERIDPRAA